VFADSRDGEHDGSAADRERSVAFDQFPPTSKPEPSWRQIRVGRKNDLSLLNAEV
jgi:hypothetical protein